MNASAQQPEEVGTLEIIQGLLNVRPAQQAFQGIDPNKPRYLFNPFNEVELDLLTLRRSGIPAIPTGVIVPITRHSYMDTNYHRFGLNELLDAHESLDQPEMKWYHRSALQIKDAFLREHIGPDEIKTGFCELEVLAGCEDFNLIFKLQTTLLPAKRFKHVDDQIDHLNRICAELRDNDDPLYLAVAEAMLDSTLLSKEWAKAALAKTIQGLEDANSERIGKSRLSKLDKKICVWLNVQEPKTPSKLDLGQNKQQPQTIVIQQPAPVAGDGIPRTQCPMCADMIRTINGKLPAICPTCTSNLAAFGASSSVPLSSPAPVTASIPLPSQNVTDGAPQTRHDQPLVNYLPTLEQSLAPDRNGQFDKDAGFTEATPTTAEGALIEALRANTPPVK